MKIHRPITQWQLSATKASQVRIVKVGRLLAPHNLHFRRNVNHMAASRFR